LKAKAKNTDNHYVDNDRLYHELKLRYPGVRAAKQAGARPPPLPPFVVEAIMLMCERTSLAKNFIGYSYRDEMIADAVENCIAGIDSFNPALSDSPFSYLTKTIWRAFVRRIQKEKRQTYTKFKLQQAMDVDVELMGDDDAPKGSVGGHRSPEQVEADRRRDMFIQNYEDAAEARKQKSLKKARARAASLEQFMDETGAKP
jgi:hypothetical protein